MKKVLSIIVVAVVATFVACGPSAEDKAKAEAKLQHDADSISAMVTAGLEAAVTDAAATTTDVAVDAAATATTAVEAEKH